MKTARVAASSSQIQCGHCGARAVEALVQHGSYFTQCTSCDAQGPSTSWLALSSQLQGHVRAVAVSSNFEVLEEVAEGEMRQIAGAISTAAHQGKLVMLLHEHAGA
jgi:hypothetical protein